MAVAVQDTISFKNRILRISLFKITHLQRYISSTIHNPFLFCFSVILIIIKKYFKKKTLKYPNYFQTENILMIYLSYEGLKGTLVNRVCNITN